MSSTTQPTLQDKSIFGIIIASISFVISLAWNDAFKNFFSKSTPIIRKYGPWGYAIAVSILGIFIINMLVKYIFVDENYKEVAN
jgi:hypothetical protein